jgi:PAS domain S-box-containing protein
MHRETLLIIDDELSILESLSLFFMDQGYHVLTAENGEKGLDLFFNQTVDMVITDLRMPGIDGIEVMNRIHNHNPDIPMVVVSGAGERQDIIRALKMGAKDYITKPIVDLDMIRHVIHKALETKHLKEQNRQYRIRLEKSEARYRTITEHIAEGVFVVDGDGNITFCNPAFCRMMGHTNEELTRMNLKDLATAQSFSDISSQTQSRKPVLTGQYEVQMISSQGQTIHLELTCSPLYDPKNTYGGAITIARDVTKLIDLRNKFKKFLKQEEDKNEKIISICANCKKIRKDTANWQRVETFFNHIAFSHGICPDCCRELYPDIDIDDLEL